MERGRMTGEMVRASKVRGLVVKAPVLAEGRKSNSRQWSQRISRASTLAIAAASIAAYEGLTTARSEAQTTYYLNTAGDGSGTTSFTNNGNGIGWYPTFPNGGTVTHAVTSANNYVVQQSSGTTVVKLRSPTGTTGTTFPGGSLTLDPYGALVFKEATTTAASFATVFDTVNNLVLSGGSVDDNPNSNQYGANLAGNATLTANTTSYFGTGNSTGNLYQMTVSSTLSGSGTLNIGDPTPGLALYGQIILTGNNTNFSGNTTFNSGNGATSSSTSLIVGSANAVAGSTLVTEPFVASLQGSTGIRFNGSSSFVIGGLSGNGNITLQNISGGAVTVGIGNNNQSTSYLGVLSGSGSFTKLGTGTLTLNNADTYTGTTTISAGTLVMGNSAAFGTAGTVNISGGSVVFNSGLGNAAFAGLTGTSNLALQDNAGSPAAIALTVGGNNASTNYSGSLSGPGSLTKTGTGRLSLTSSSSYTGTTSVSAGGLLVAGNLSSTSVMVASSAYLTATGNGTSTGIIGGNVIVSPGGSIDFSKDGTVTSNQTLTVGSLNLSTGTSTAAASSLSFNIVSGPTSDTISSPGGLYIDNTNGGSIYVNLGGTFNAGTYTLMTYAAGQTGMAPFGVYTNGTPGAPFVIGTNGLVGAASYTFNDSSTALTLQIQAAAAPAPALAYWYGGYASTPAGGSNATVGTFGGNDGNISNTITNFSADSLGTTDTNQVPGAITDVVFSASQNSGGSLSGTNIAAALDGNYTINSLTVNATPASTTIGGTGNLTLNAASGSLYSGGGTGIFINSGAGPVTINTSGQVMVAQSQSWTNASASPFNVSSAIAGTATTGNTTILTLSNSNTGNTALSGAISDGTAGGKLALLINNTGGGITYLSAANSYSGGTNISAGTLSISNGNNLGTAPGTPATNIMINGGTLQINAVSTSNTGVVTINTNRSLLIGSAGATINIPIAMTGNFATAGSETDTIYDGAITGTGGGGLTITGGSGTNSGSNAYVIELGANNTYNGNTTINNATVSFTNNPAVAGAYNNTIPATTVLNIINHGMFVLCSGASNQTLAGLTGDSTSLLGTANTGSTNTLTILPATGMTYTYSGSMGGLTLPGKTGSNARLAVVIGNGGSATGTEIFAGSNSYSGNTNLGSGTLQLANSTAVQNSTVIMAGGNLNFSSGLASATLGGITGTGNLALTDITGGSIALSIGNNSANTGYSGNLTDGGAGGSLTKIGTGTTTLSGSNTYSGNTAVNAGTLEFMTEQALYGANQSSWTPAKIQVASAATLAMNLGTGAFSVADASTLISNLSNNSTGGGFSAGAFVGLDYSGASPISLSSVIADSNAGSLGLVKLGTGTVALTGSNTYSGGTNITNGTLVMSNLASFGSSGMVIENNTAMIGITSDSEVADSSFNLTNHPTTYVALTPGNTSTGQVGIAFQNYNSSLNFSGIPNVRLGAASGTPSVLLGNVQTGTGPQSTLTFSGPGTLTLAGTVQSSELFVRQGSLILSGAAASVNATAFSSVGLSVGDNASLTLQNGAVLSSTSDFNISDQGGATPNTGLVTIADSTSGLTVTNLYVGKGAVGTTNPNNNVGTLNQLAGTTVVSGVFQIGVYGNGTYNLSGGALNLTGTGSQFQMGMQSGAIANLNISGTGALNASGSSIYVLNNNGGVGTSASITLSGSGSFNAPNAAVSLGQFGAPTNSNVPTSTLTLSGSSTFLAKSIKLGGANGGSYTDDVINLNGGTIIAQSVIFGADLLAASSTNGVINANGGTVQASAASTSFFAGDYINLQAGGA